ncbi:response regulator [Lysobacter sp. HA35]
MSLRVLIVEDHPVMRFGVMHLIRQEWPDAGIAEATSLAAAVELAASPDWSVVLLDLSLPDSSGLEGLVRLRRLMPATPILILSMHDEAAYAARALQAGASGYLTKEHATTELLAAIARVRSGGRYLSSGFTDRLAGMLTGEKVTALPHELLSAQEHRVMVMIANGKAPSEIAETMHLSVKTVGTYRTRIREKTGLGSTAEMARYCVQHGLLDPT